MSEAKPEQPGISPEAAAFVTAVNPMLPHGGLLRHEQEALARLFDQHTARVRSAKDALHAELREEIGKREAAEQAIEEIKEQGRMWLSHACPDVADVKRERDEARAEAERLKGELAAALELLTLAEMAAAAEASERRRVHEEIKALRAQVRALELAQGQPCDECDPSFGCFDGSASCCKVPIPEPDPRKATADERTVDQACSCHLGSVCGEACGYGRHHSGCAREGQ